MARNRGIGSAQEQVATSVAPCIDQAVNLSREIDSRLIEHCGVWAGEMFYQKMVTFQSRKYAKEMRERGFRVRRPIVQMKMSWQAFLERSS